jgi:lipopolysaccharide export system permease protein
MMVMGYTVLGYLPTILTLSLFIAIVGTSRACTATARW